MENDLLKYEKLIKDYIYENIHKTLKGANDYLNYPFVDPGSVYDGNLWDWDSFWAVYALFNLARNEEEKALFIKHAKGNIFNFFESQLDDGYIPMMIEKTDLPEPYLNMKHKEGVIMNMHKPFLCQQIRLISDYCSDYSWVKNYFNNMIKYFECYDRYYFNSNCGLYVWVDDIMIGMDNDPASFGRPKSSTANIFLNSFMAEELNAMADICKKFGEDEKAQFFIEKRKALIGAIQDECWDVRDKFFYSVDVDIKTRKFDWFHVGLGVFWKTLPIKVRTWSGFLPMWANFADSEQAAYLVKHLKDTGTFASDYGVTTLAKDEKMFNLDATNNPSNWLGPVWLVSNYVVFKGLLNYGYVDEARDMCSKTVLLLGRDLEKTGTIHEYYNPFNGEPVMNGGFLNWNILVLNMINEINIYNDKRDKNG